jgi:hypothetical protein
LKTEDTYAGPSQKETELQSNGVKVPLDLLDELEAKYNTAPGMRDGRMIIYLNPFSGGPLAWFNSTFKN